MKKVMLTTTELSNVVQILSIIGKTDDAVKKARDYILDKMHIENDLVEIVFDENETRFVVLLAVDIYCTFLLDCYAELKLKIGGPDNE